jgi:hypothetical protein
MYLPGFNFFFLDFCKFKKNQIFLLTKKSNFVIYLHLELWSRLVEFSGKVLLKL